ncbi:centrosome-associated protein CEP250-like isoform X2 [Lathamus discolor]|uniref:centrosome-associated protein CEP250-like isoform X2 n=1 Tax=Lathamus discolor TaxID=678569 RepID=UPI0032B74A99
MSSTEAECASELCKKQPAKRQERTQVYHQQESAGLDLEQPLQESSGQVHALAGMCSEKKLLVHKVAALEVQLAALEQDRQGLSEQLTPARSVNEPLEYSLSEAQQDILQLEITKSQLETQLETVTQANEVIQGEVKCLRWKLEAERSLMQEERKNMAEQLLQAEQQHNKTLELRETDHEVEGNKLLQALHERDRLQAVKAKALQETLTYMITILSEREGETLCQEQTRTLEKQKEMHETARNQIINNVTDENPESLQKQNQEAEEATEMLLRAVREHVEQTLETLKGKDRLLAIQRQQTRSYEEKTEEKINVLRKDLEYAMAVLKEKDFVIESQKEVIETFQNQEQDSEQQKKTLQQLEVLLKEKDQEIVSLRKQCEACSEKEKKHGAEQKNLQATKQTLKEREEKIRALEEAVSKLQQQKEESAVMTKAIQQKLQYMESSLGAREKEIMSLQGHVQDLQKQKELAGKQAKTLEQDLEKMRQRLKENNLEFLKQTKESNMSWLCGNLLEKVAKKRDTDRFHHQATAEGVQQSWLLEKKLLLQQLESLQQEVARLKLANTELKEFNTELKKTLEEVKQAFTAHAKPHSLLEHHTSPQRAVWGPLLVPFPLPLSPWTHPFVFSFSSGTSFAFANARSLQYHPSCPGVPIHTHTGLSCVRKCFLLLFLVHSLH